MSRPADPLVAGDYNRRVTLHIIRLKSKKKLRNWAGPVLRQPTQLGIYDIMPAISMMQGIFMSTTTMPGTIQETDEAVRAKTIPPYKVIFLNDNVTTMEFVIYLLIAIFKKDPTT